MKAQVVIVLIAMMFVESHQQEKYECRTKCWTEWLDRDDPSGTGDFETRIHLMDEYPGLVCEKPLGIEARTKPGGISAAAAGEVIDTYNPYTGFICKNNQQEDRCCMDYEVRFCCPHEFCEQEPEPPIMCPLGKD